MWTLPNVEHSYFEFSSSQSLGCGQATSYGGPQLHGKVFLLTTKSIINFITEKSISPRQNQFHRGKTNFIHGKIDFITPKSFWLSRSRDISSQSAMGVHPTWQSSSWFHDSTSTAETVEKVCLQQHISTCIVDKVSRVTGRWMYLNTHNVFTVLICNWLTCRETQNVGE